MNPEKGLQLEGLVERLTDVERNFFRNLSDRNGTVIKWACVPMALLTEAAQAITTLEAERDEWKYTWKMACELAAEDTIETNRTLRHWIANHDNVVKLKRVQEEYKNAFYARALAAEAALQASEARVKELEGALSETTNELRAVRQFTTVERIALRDLEVVSINGVISRAQAALTSGGEGLTVSQSRPKPSAGGEG